MPNKKIQIPEIKRDGISIEKVSAVNCLGLTIDEQLNWNKHIQHISNKCFKIIKMLNKLKHMLQMNIKKLVIQYINNASPELMLNNMDIPK